MSEPGGFDEWMWHFRHIQAREIAGQHWAWIDATEPTFGPEIEERFSWALGVSDDQAQAGAKARDAFTRRIVEMVSGGRVLCLPTAPNIAPRLEVSAEELVDHRSRTLGLTAVAGLSGLPQITMPLAELEGCPLGLSLIGPPGGDMMLLTFAEAFAGNNTAP